LNAFIHDADIFRVRKTDPDVDYSIAKF